MSKALKAIFIAILLAFICPVFTKVHSQEVIKDNNQAKAIFTVDKTTALADGKDRIKITYGDFWIAESTASQYYLETSKGASPSNPRPHCMTGASIPIHVVINGVWLTVTGESNVVVNEFGPVREPALGNTATKRYAIDNGNPGTQGSFDCQTGYVYAYISSTKAETKTLTLEEMGAGKGGAGAEGYDEPANPFQPITITFTNPTQAPANNSTIKPSASKATPAPTPVKPTLTLTSLARITTASTSSKTITIGTGSNPVLRKDQTFTLSGTTSPNAKVTFTIQSNPITKEVTADTSGTWTYTLNPKELKLALGSHTITAQAEVNGVKSDSQELLKFTLKNPPVNPIAPKEPYNYFNAINISAAILILAGLGFLSFRIIKKQKTKQSSPKEQNE